MGCFVLPNNAPLGVTFRTAPAGQSHNDFHNGMRDGAARAYLQSVLAHADYCLQNGPGSRVDAMPALPDVLYVTSNTHLASVLPDLVDDKVREAALSPGYAVPGGHIGPLQLTRIFLEPDARLHGEINAVGNWDSVEVRLEFPAAQDGED